ncbi:DUF6608 family protein [Salipaludibacillus daqingensis]|uniref:DUF6608 family protein n=1 Tax=Salipaludibacillus daqingensis TaxID=3041001 RepID=UPI002474670C|nr:DUF6608 family protein [Salipaludibacillus daqingensis]
MKSKIMVELKRGFLFFCVIFAITTLISSSIQLFSGQPTDLNIHILNRAAIVLIAVITISLFDRIKLKSKVFTYVVPYVISMGIVFLYVWLTGFFVTLHPNAYRDIFLNFTAVTIGVIAVIIIKDKINKKT